MLLRNALLAALVAAPVVLAVPLTPSTARADDGYRIGPGDVLEIGSYEDERLAGRRRVSPDGAISLPFVGEVSVAGLTPAAATARLAERMGEHLPAGRSLTVEVFEHAPVFVVGDVDRPGAQPFRPGMIVLELVALGGGEWRPPTARDQMSLIQIEQEMADQRLRRFALRAQLARIEAENRGAPFDPAATRPDPFVDDADARAILAAEASLHEANRQRYEAARAALAAQRESFAAEILTLQESIALHDEEIRLLAEETASVADLVARGLAVQTRESALRRELTAARRDALELRLSLARARQSELAIDQRLADLDGERRSANALALATIELETARIDQRLAGAASALAEGLDATRDQAARAALTTRYAVIRRENGSQVEIAVDELAEVRPGDILRVSRGPGLDRAQLPQADERG